MANRVSAALVGVSAASDNIKSRKLRTPAHKDCRWWRRYHRKCKKCDLLEQHVLPLRLGKHGPANSYNFLSLSKQVLTVDPPLYFGNYIEFFPRKIPPNICQNFGFVSFCSTCECENRKRMDGLVAACLKLWKLLSHNSYWFFKTISASAMPLQDLDLGTQLGISFVLPKQAVLQVVEFIR